MDLTLAHFLAFLGAGIFGILLPKGLVLFSGIDNSKRSELREFIVQVAVSNVANKLLISEQVGIQPDIMELVV